MCYRSQLEKIKWICIHAALAGFVALLFLLAPGGVFFDPAVAAAVAPVIIMVMAWQLCLAMLVERFMSGERLTFDLISLSPRRLHVGFASLSLSPAAPPPRAIP